MQVENKKEITGFDFKVKRMKLGYHQREIANLFGCSRETISAIENSGKVNPSRWLALNNLNPKVK